MTHWIAGKKKSEKSVTLIAFDSDQPWLITKRLDENTQNDQIEWPINKYNSRNNKYM